MYKATFANGNTWYEWIKMGPHDFNVLIIHGDGTHTFIDSYDKQSLAQAYVRDMNSRITDSAKYIVANMTDGNKYLNKKDLRQYRVPEWPATNAPF